MATLYFRSTGTNWGTAGDWSATPSPGYTAGSVPTTADDVILEAASANIIINASNRVCKTLTATAYTGQWTPTFGVTAAGSITLGAAMTFGAGTGFLGINATGTLTSNAKAWPNQFRTSTAGTFTLADDWNVGSFLHSNSLLMNGFKLYVSGGVTMTGNNLGTTEVIMTGGTWSGVGVVNMEFQGVVTISGTVTARNLKHTSGAITSTGSTVNFNPNGGTCTVDMNSISLTNIGSSSVTGTVSIISPLIATGNMTTSGGTVTYNQSGGGSLSVQGNFTNGSTTIGSAIVQLTGSGNISGTATCGLDITINTGGSYTSTSNLTLNNAKTFTRTAGTIVPGAFTLTLSGSYTLNATSIPWQNLTVANSVGTTTVTVNSALTGTGTLSILNANPTVFSGSAGLTFPNWSCIVAGAAITLVSGVTYGVTSDLVLMGTNALPLQFVASLVNSTKAIFTLSPGATQSVLFVTSTDIDSGLGQTVWDTLGTGAVLTRDINWNPGSRPSPYVAIY